MITIPELAFSTLIDTIFNDEIDFANLKHPEYAARYRFWLKWRLSYEAGYNFTQLYLQKFSQREDFNDYERRRNLAYVPAFAKSAVNEVLNSIFQRITDVTRAGGTASYQAAVAGKKWGIDLKGSTMNSFIGREVLPDLLVMAKVGVYVDMPQVTGNTLLDKYNKSPYLYKYAIEDILNWVYSNTEEGIELKTLLLRDHIYKIDENTKLPNEISIRYRFYWVDNGKTYLHFFNVDSEPITRQGDPGQDVIELNLPAIPFVVFELSNSLMADIADYQIALLNLASSDISYVLKSNFPFYVEQYDPRSEMPYARPPSPMNNLNINNNVLSMPAEAQDAALSKNEEIIVGTSSGRRIPKGLDYPTYIHPSSEPLTASMEKQAELKADIRSLLMLTLASTTAGSEATGSGGGNDVQGLEAGLSAIGQELEHGEKLITKFWTLYEDPSAEPATIRYPKKYSLLSDKDRQEKAASLLKSANNIPSLTYKKEAMKQSARTLLGNQLSLETLEKIEAEIDKAQVVVSDPDELNKDVEQGLVDAETASKAKNYPDGSVEKAKKEHAERLARIEASQSQSRGVPDKGGLANASKAEKQDNNLNVDPATADSQTRGGAAT